MPNSPTEEEALRARAAVGLADLGSSVLLRATGGDRVSFLHRMVSCDVKSVPEGRVVPGLLLTAKGKVVADFLLGVLPDRVEMRAGPGARPALRDGLARFVIADDCVLEDRSGVAGLISFLGPRAAEAAAGVVAVAIPEDGAVEADCQGARVLLYRCRRAGLPAVDIAADVRDLPGLLDAAAVALARHDGCLLGPGALEVLRIEGGEPRLGAEFDGETLPQEAGLTGHVSFTKGCFLGQEPVARLQNRGHTNRGLAGLLLDPDAAVPERGALVLDGEREVGAVTSACRSPSLGRPVALALLRHESSSPGTRLGLRTAGGVLSCAVTGLPFVAGH